jgi:DNA-directed RNA polymerase subunit RPC12/RpoP
MAVVKVEDSEKEAVLSERCVPHVSGCTKISLDPIDKSDQLSIHQDQSLHDSLDQIASSPLFESQSEVLVFTDYKTEDSNSWGTRCIQRTGNGTTDCLNQGSPILETPHRHLVFTDDETESSNPSVEICTHPSPVLPDSWSLQDCSNQSTCNPTTETEKKVLDLGSDLLATKMQEIDEEEIYSLVSRQGSLCEDTSDSMTSCSPIVISHRRRPIFIDSDSDNSIHSPITLQPAHYEEVEREVLVCEGPITVSDDDDDDSEDDENGQKMVSHESSRRDFDMKLLRSQLDLHHNSEEENDDRELVDKEGNDHRLKPKKSVHFDCDIVQLMNDLSLKPTSSTKPVTKPGNKENIPSFWEAGFRTTIKSPFPGLQTPSYTPIRTPLSALSSSEPGRKYSQYRNDMVSDLKYVFNETVFDNQLPDDLEVTWNKRLTKTAGRTMSSRKRNGQHVAKIELSTKVCDRYDRLRDTLIHEMCHAATWLISRCKHDNHGPQWQSWAQKAMKAHPELPKITTCHSYEIHKKYTYKCTFCLYTIGRHSKIREAKCPHCGSLIELMPKMKKDGTPAQPRALNRWMEFVNKNRDEVRRDHPGISQKALMKQLGAMYKDEGCN